MSKRNEFSLLQNVNWEYLKRFKICAESRNFKEAAQVIGTTPNTIVTQLDALEESLGFTLFERTHQNRTHKLTFQGERVLQLISIASLYLSGSRPVENHSLNQESFKSKIKIVTTPGLASSLMPHMVDTFLQKYPFYQFEVFTSGPAIEFQSDEVVIRTDVKDHPEIVKEVLGDVSMNLYASKEYLEKMGEPTKLEDLKKHKVFTFNSFTHGNTNWGLLPGEGYPVITQISSNSIDFLHEMCVKGYGIVEFAHIYKHSPDLVHILKNVESPKHTIYFAFHKSNLLDFNMSKFISFVLEHFQNKFDQILNNNLIRG